MRSPHRFRQTYSAPGIGGTLSSIDDSSPALVWMMDNCINVPYNLRRAQLGFPLLEHDFTKLFAVELERLTSFFSSSPSAKLLRSPHAAHIICFLESQFKSSGSITNPHSLLRQQLAEFQETIHQSDPDVLRDRTETYLTNWSTGDSRWLRRYHDVNHAEPVYELTPHTEDVLKFLNDVLQRSLGFVGTESRLKRIIDTLSDIVIRGSSDPTRRLEHLHAKRLQIDREIQAIDSGEAVATYSPTAIRERFIDAVSDLASLQSDFRAVEESFKNITRDVQKRHNEMIGSRGDILGFALDAEDTLKSQDQGIRIRKTFLDLYNLIICETKRLSNQDGLPTNLSLPL